MNKHKASDRRAARRAKAVEWLKGEYKALKVYARMQGVFDDIPWHEFERLPTNQMWARRFIVAMWVEEVQITNPPPRNPSARWAHLPHPRKTPTDWLNWSWHHYLKEKK